MTDKRLCTFKLKNSPTCSLSSSEDGTEFHNMFSCRAFDAERAILRAAMKSGNSNLDDWTDLWDCVESNGWYFRLFPNLFLESGCF